MRGNIIKLSGLSRHGKNRVRQFGEKWIVISEPECMVCFNNETGIQVAPVVIDNTTNKLTIDKNNVRNIRFPVDKDFEYDI